MTEQPSFPIPMGSRNGHLSRRCIVTFREGEADSGMSALKAAVGVQEIVRSPEHGRPESNQAILLPHLGMAIVACDADQRARLQKDPAILAVEPDGVVYALQEKEPTVVDYFRGYRDAVNELVEKISERPRVRTGIADAYVDDAISTWGLKAIGAVNSHYTGANIRIAVLDTGIDLSHPDFVGRRIVAESFVGTPTAHDGNGHGTHCIGTACGYKDQNGRRYGVAYESDIYAGKVLNDSGTGYHSDILQGIEWAVANECHVISMSLGNQVPTSSMDYELAGQRALNHGCLIIAAAGNHGPGTVGQPANSPSVMAVGAVDSRLDMAWFSSPSGPAPGANVDLVGPGIAVYSSVPLDMGRYATFNGTSMATPHVAGTAALYAEAYRARGWQLWQLITSRARRLDIPASHAGAGLVQTP